MTNNFQAQQTYKVAQREFTSTKEIELKVFAVITGNLKKVDMNAVGAHSELADALLENAKLWNIIFIDLINPENPLPMPLKESLISLAEFTQKHTVEVLSGNATHQVLIDINTDVIKGLRDSIRMKTAETQAQPEAA
ncbi:MAG: flagellar biosynthesis regulator FlaF [Alphaproteobacteria bacterium]